MKYTCIDSFSGAGGLSLGLQSVGFELLMSFDFDPKCIETHKMNSKYFKYPAVLSDIDAMLNGGILKHNGLKKGELFLLAGGPPCQGFSVQRRGKDEDDRNTLVDKYISLVLELMPYYFLMENVPGITGKRGKIILDGALERAGQAGYAVTTGCLNAQDYGVPQRRRRFIAVGVRQDCSSLPYSFPEPTNPEGKRITVRDAIGDLPPPPEDGRDHPEIIHHKRDRLSNINKLRLKALKPGQGRDHLPEELLADCHKVTSSVIGHRNVYGRMLWDDVAPTITARFDSFTRGMFGHPEQIRSISLREGALLQTYPKDFIFSGNKVDIARQIGNAVPPVFGAKIGESIIEHYERLVETGG